VALILVAVAILSPSWVSAQVINHDVSSSVTTVLSGVITELVGQVRLARSAGAGVQTTQNSAIYFQYQGVPITNPFDGFLNINTATGVAFHSGGITLTVTGGYINSSVQVQVTNTGSGAGTTGVVTVILPAGLSIAQGDYINVNGIRVDVTPKPLNSVVSCFISSQPGGSHFFSASPISVAQVLAGSFRFITSSPLPDGFFGIN